MTTPETDNSSNNNYEDSFEPWGDYPCETCDKPLSLHEREDGLYYCPEDESDPDES